MNVRDELNKGTMGMLAACFRQITMGDRRAEQFAWEAGARCLDDVAEALEGGLPPDEVALVCRAAAKAIRHPKQRAQLQAEAARKLEGT